MKYLESIFWLLSWPVMIFLSYLLVSWTVKRMKKHTDE